MTVRNSSNIKGMTLDETFRLTLGLDEIPEMKRTNVQYIYQQARAEADGFGFAGQQGVIPEEFEEVICNPGLRRRKPVVGPADVIRLYE